MRKGGMPSSLKPYSADKRKDTNTTNNNNNNTNNNNSNDNGASASGDGEKRWQSQNHLESDSNREGLYSPVPELVEPSTRGTCSSSPPHSSLLYSEQVLFSSMMRLMGWSVRGFTQVSLLLTALEDQLAQHALLVDDAEVDLLVDGAESGTEGLHGTSSHHGGGGINIRCLRDGSPLEDRYAGTEHQTDTGNQASSVNAPPTSSPPRTMKTKKTKRNFLNSRTKAITKPLYNNASTVTTITQAPTRTTPQREEEVDRRGGGHPSREPRSHGDSTPVFFLLSHVEHPFYCIVLQVEEDPPRSSDSSSTISSSTSISDGIICEVQRLQLVMKNSVRTPLLETAKEGKPMDGNPSTDGHYSSKDKRKGKIDDSISNEGNNNNKKNRNKKTDMGVGSVDWAVGRSLSLQSLSMLLARAAREGFAQVTSEDHDEEAKQGRRSRSGSGTDPAADTRERADEEENALPLDSSFTHEERRSREKRYGFLAVVKLPASVFFVTTPHTPLLHHPPTAPHRIADVAAGEEEEKEKGKEGRLHHDVRIALNHHRKRPLREEDGDDEEERTQPQPQPPPPQQQQPAEEEEEEEKSAPLRRSSKSGPVEALSMPSQMASALTTSPVSSSTPLLGGSREHHDHDHDAFHPLLLPPLFSPAALSRILGRETGGGQTGITTTPPRTTTPTAPPLFGLNHREEEDNEEEREGRGIGKSSTTATEGREALTRSEGGEGGNGRNDPHSTTAAPVAVTPVVVVGNSKNKSKNKSTETVHGNEGQSGSPEVLHSASEQQKGNTMSKSHKKTSLAIVSVDMKQEESSLPLSRASPRMEEDNEGMEWKESAATRSVVAEKQKAMSATTTTVAVTVTGEQPSKKKKKAVIDNGEGERKCTDDPNETAAQLEDEVASPFSEDKKDNGVEPASCQSVGDVVRRIWSGSGFRTCIGKAAHFHCAPRSPSTGDTIHIHAEENSHSKETDSSGMTSAPAHIPTSTFMSSTQVLAQTRHIHKRLRHHLMYSTRASKPQKEKEAEEEEMVLSAIGEPHAHGGRTPSTPTRNSTNNNNNNNKSLQSRANRKRQRDQKDESRGSTSAAQLPEFSSSLSSPPPATPARLLAAILSGRLRREEVRAEMKRETEVATAALYALYQATQRLRGQRDHESLHCPQPQQEHEGRKEEKEVQRAAHRSSGGAPGSVDVNDGDRTELAATLAMEHLLSFLPLSLPRSALVVADVLYASVQSRMEADADVRRYRPLPLVSRSSSPPLLSSPPSSSAPKRQGETRIKRETLDGSGEDDQSSGEGRLTEAEGGDNWNNDTIGLVFSFPLSPPRPFATLGGPLSTWARHLVHPSFDVLTAGIPDDTPPLLCPSTSPAATHSSRQSSIPTTAMTTSVTAVTSTAIPSPEEPPIPGLLLSRVALSRSRPSRGAGSLGAGDHGTPTANSPPNTLKNNNSNSNSSGGGSRRNEEEEGGHGEEAREKTMDHGGRVVACATPSQGGYLPWVELTPDDPCWHPTQRLPRLPVLSDIPFRSSLVPVLCATFSAVSPFGGASGAQRLTAGITSSHQNNNNTNNSLGNTGDGSSSSSVMRGSSTAASSLGKVTTAVTGVVKVKPCPTTPPLSISTAATRITSSLSTRTSEGSGTRTADQRLRGLLSTSTTTTTTASAQVLSPLVTAAPAVLPARVSLSSSSAFSSHSPTYLYPSRTAPLYLYGGDVHPHPDCSTGCIRAAAAPPSSSPSSATLAGRERSSYSLSPSLSSSASATASTSMAFSTPTPGDDVTLSRHQEDTVIHKLRIASRQGFPFALVQNPHEDIRYQVHRRFMPRDMKDRLDLEYTRTAGPPVTSLTGSVAPQKAATSVAVQTRLQDETMKRKNTISEKAGCGGRGEGYSSPSDYDAADDVADTGETSTTRSRRRLRMEDKDKESHRESGKGALVPTLEDELERIDEILKKKEDLPRVPMPDVEWRYF